MRWEDFEDFLLLDSDLEPPNAPWWVWVLATVATIGLALYLDGCDQYTPLTPVDPGHVTCRALDASIVFADAAAPTYCPSCQVGQVVPDAGPKIGAPCVVKAADGTEICKYTTAYELETIDALCEDCLPAGGGTCVCFGLDEPVHQIPDCPTDPNFCATR